jgi:hypothetical protein
LVPATCGPTTQRGSLDPQLALRMIETGRMDTASMIAHRSRLGSVVAVIETVTNREAIKVVVLPGYRRRLSRPERFNPAGIQVEATSGAAAGERPSHSDLSIPIERSNVNPRRGPGPSGHSRGHSTCRNAPGQNRTRWTSPPT